MPPWRRRPSTARAALSLSLFLRAQSQAAAHANKRRTNGHGLERQAVGDVAQGHKHFALKRNTQQFYGFWGCWAQASASRRRRLTSSRYKSPESQNCCDSRPSLSLDHPVKPPVLTAPAARHWSERSLTSIRFALFIQVLCTLLPAACSHTTNTTTSARGEEAVCTGPKKAHSSEALQHSWGTVIEMEHVRLVVLRTLGLATEPFAQKYLLKPRTLKELALLIDGLFGGPLPAQIHPACSEKSHLLCW